MSSIFKIQELFGKFLTGQERILELVALNLYSDIWTLIFLLFVIKIPWFLEDKSTQVGFLSGGLSGVQ